MKNQKKKIVSHMHILIHYAANKKNDSVHKQIFVTYRTGWFTPLGVKAAADATRSAETVPVNFIV